MNMKKFKLEWLLLLLGNICLRIFVPFHVVVGRGTSGVPLAVFVVIFLQFVLSFGIFFCVCINAYVHLSKVSGRNEFRLFWLGILFGFVLIAGTLFITCVHA